MQGTVADSEIRIERMRDPGKVKRKEGKEKMFFEKAKKIAKELGLESVRDLHQIATSISLVAIKGYFGLP